MTLIQFGSAVCFNDTVFNATGSGSSFYTDFDFCFDAINVSANKIDIFNVSYYNPSSDGLVNNFSYIHSTNAQINGSSFPYASTGLSTIREKKIISDINTINGTFTINVSGVIPYNLIYSSDTSTYQYQYERENYTYYPSNDTIVVYLTGVENGINSLGVRENFDRNETQEISYSDVADRNRLLSEIVTQDIIPNDNLDRMSAFFKIGIINIDMNFVLDRTAYFFRNITQLFQIENIATYIKSISKTVTQPISFSEVLNRASGIFRNLLDFFGLGSSVERTAYFFRNESTIISLANNAESTGGIFIIVSQQLSFSEISKRTIDSTIYISDFFGITESATRTVWFLRTIIDSFQINNYADISNRLHFKPVTQQITSVLNMNMNKGLGIDISNALNVNDIISRTQTISRDVIDQFSITELSTRFQDISKSIINFFGITDNLNLFRELSGRVDLAVAFSDSVGRTQTLSRESQQTLSLDLLFERTASISRSVTQFFQMFFSLFSSKIELDPWTKITSVEEKIQTPALEGEVVYWKLKDTWTVDNYPRNWTNVTKTYELPSSANGINVFIDGVNYTGTSWISNVSNIWTVINNNTLGALDTAVINFTYNTAATASEEATWLAYNKRVGENTTWRNTITMVNPSTENYTNIGINITTDSNAIASTVWVQNDTGDLVPHTFTQSNGNVNWTHDLPSGNSVFVIEYKNSEINLTQTNYTTSTGQIQTYYNLTVSTNSTRDVKTTYASFNFTDVGVVSNRFYKCTNDTYSDCTEEITDRVDVNFDDISGDGRDDFIEWFIATMNNNTPGTYQLVSDSGFPIQTTETEEILNAPIKPFDTISWRTTVTMYNPNSFATEKTLKYEFPTGVRDIELDDIGKNLQYDPYGVLSPYVTIIDSDDTEHLTSVYLSPGETKIFVLTYKTDSITVFTSTFFPDYFKVGEMSEVTKVLRIKNQAEKDVSDLEHRIAIDYAEDLRVCDGEYERGCPDEGDGNYENVTIDTDSLIKGDYKLELENIEAGETKIVTLTYYVPTANVEKEDDGRRSIDGILTNFRKYEILSSAHFTMDDVRLREGEIPCNQIVDVLSCRANGLCDLPIAYVCDTNLKLGSFAVGERKTVYLWYIEDEAESENPSLWYRILEFGNRYYLEKGSVAYYLFGFLGVEEDGQLYVTTGRIILFLSAIIFIMLSFILILYLGKKSK